MVNLLCTFTIIYGHHLIYYAKQPTACDQSTFYPCTLLTFGHPAHPFSARSSSLLTFSFLRLSAVLSSLVPKTGPQKMMLYYFYLMLKDKPNHHKTQDKKDKPKRKMAVLRLEKDLQSYAEQKISFVRLSFPEEDNIQIIDVSIRIEEQQSVYRGCKITFRLTFPDMYPMDAPKVKCLNHIYHPNISYEGSVCLPLVREDYSPTVTLTMIVCGLIFIMTYPNAEDPLNPPIGTLMLKDHAMFSKIVDYTLAGRTFEGKPYDALKFQ